MAKTPLKSTPIESWLVADIVSTLYLYSNNVDPELHRRKLLTFANRVAQTCDRYYYLIRTDAERCGARVCDLARRVAQDPERLAMHLSHVEIQHQGNVVTIRWGYPPYVAAPPIASSVEFAEGARTWPAQQLVVYERRGKEVVESGLKRSVEVSCTVLGAIALGMGAAYVGGSLRQGQVRLLIPLTDVDYCRPLIETLYKADCELPEHLVRLLIIAHSERPTTYLYVGLGYDHRPTISYEILVDTAPYFTLSLVLERHRETLRRLAIRWCECNREGWPSECRDVEQASNALLNVLYYVETGVSDKAYEALRHAVELERTIRNAVMEILS